jgi:hypothetical protein
MDKNPTLRAIRSVMYCETAVDGTQSHVIAAALSHIHGAKRTIVGDVIGPRYINIRAKDATRRASDLRGTHVTRGQTIVQNDASPAIDE